MEDDRTVAANSDIGGGGAADGGVKETKTADRAGGTPLPSSQPLVAALYFTKKALKKNTFEFLEK